MKINPIRLKDKPLFDKYLSEQEHYLAAYAFENIFIWQAMYDIFWIKIDKNLCLFFKDRIGCFLYLPPLGGKFNDTVVKRCFEIMNKINKNRVISRIENIQERQIDFYRRLRYRIILGGCDYICKRQDLATLKGNLFKKKRAAANYFARHYSFDYKAYRSQDEAEAIALYRFWSDGRKTKYKDAIYHKLLDDNFSIFKTTLKNYQRLNLVGRIVRIENKIRSITLGYPLGKNSFVVLFEVCDLNFYGIAQYIFREFCRELNYPMINIMDDSGLENLKKTKLSYRPYKKENNFIACCE